MSPIEIAIIVALCIYSVYRQSIRHEVTGKARFKMGLIYGIVGVVWGGFYLPSSAISWALLLLGIALSAVVGYARGLLTRLWVEDGRVYSQGTALTIGLFFGLISAKFAIGTVEYFTGTSSHGGFGEVLVLIAIMIAFQAEIIWRRAQPLLALPPVAPGTRHQALE